jgi:hypothetical protein
MPLHNPASSTILFPSLISVSPSVLHSLTQPLILAKASPGYPSIDLKRQILPFERIFSVSGGRKSIFFYLINFFSCGDRDLRGPDLGRRLGVDGLMLMGGAGCGV